MTQDEIAKLKERLRIEHDEKIKAVEADYKRKLEAVDLVAEMLIEPTLEAISSNGNGSSPAPTSVSAPALAVPPVMPITYSRPPLSGIDSDIEASFKGRSDWTVPQVHAALNLPDYQRGTVWNAVQRLVDFGKVRCIKPGSGRRAATYAWIEEIEEGSNDNVS